MKNIFRFPILLCFAFTLPNAFAQPGSLDPTFGLGGKLVTDVPAGRTFTIAPDGKFLIMGDSALFLPIKSDVYRLQPNGSRDSSFGVNGRTIIPSADLCAVACPSVWN
ncbi:MAG: hypothetical protein ABIQ93_16255, partial [Saprospiraceae bacterium]